jgi:hypothetical protein
MLVLRRIQLLMLALSTVGAFGDYGSVMFETIMNQLIILKNSWLP